jgi:hypothetical protein
MSSEYRGQSWRFVRQLKGLPAKYVSAAQGANYLGWS